ncbi:hypothetical protein CRYUN_Cryun08bG0024900 [Craigia yunnanensis]
MAEEQQRIKIPRVKLGTQGLEVSKLGFGCMGLSGTYNDPVPDDVGILIIKHTFDRGITFFDTADIYGPKTNEILVGKALKQLPREKVQLATKFGIVKRDDAAGAIINGTPEYVRASIEASLKRLDVEYIDLYYQHRVDTTTPIEDTMGELKKLVEEGKIKYIGLSEPSPETIKRAHVVHPITALQMEWSLWTRDIEEEIVPLCRELGIGIVPYSPLGHGFFGGKAVVQSLPANSVLSTFPRFQRENLERNKSLYLQIEKLAQKHGSTPSQLALAWVLHQGDDVAPIPGTTKIKNLDSNIDSLKLKLTEEDLKEICDMIPITEVAGATRPGSLTQFMWKFGNTPPKESKISRLGRVYQFSSVPDFYYSPSLFVQQVSKFGFGCMGLTGTYNSPLPEEEGKSIIKNAFAKGITFFDTADVYGAHSNEVLVGKALKQLPREKIQLATKFGIAGMAPTGMIVKGSPEYVRSCCEGSLKRLEVDYIDLYYQHLMDASVPIEETMGELKKLVEEGKIKYIGLSESSPDTIRRAHAVHPITAVQMVWSLWTREIEDEIVPLCRELGIGIVPYSPIGCGFFSGRAIIESLPASTFLAKKRQCTPAQLALAWVLQQGVDVVPIPGTTKIKNLDQNIGSLRVKLTAEDLKEISDAVPIEEVAGDRNYDSMRKASWKFANTPPKDIGVSA